MRKAKPAQVFCCNQEYTDSRPWIQRGVLITHFNHFSWQKNTYEGETATGLIPQQGIPGSRRGAAQTCRAEEQQQPRPGRSMGTIPGGAESRAQGCGQGWPAGPHSCQEKALPCPKAGREPPRAPPCLSTRCPVTHHPWARESVNH